MSKPIKQWMQYFDQQAETYDQNGFTQFTEKEIDFILGVYPIVAGSRILDVGCGTGRHSIELARRGFQVTGIDLSPNMLKVARAKRDTAGLQIDFFEADATDFQLDGKFDAAICLCEGAVGIVEQGEDAEAHDRSIFSQVAAHLKPNSPFVLTCLNGYAIIRQMKDELILEGRFNPATMEANYLDELDTPEGRKPFHIHERLFIAPEVSRILSECGFQVDNVYGGTAGHWSFRPLSLDEVEAMFLCRRKS